MAAPAGWSVRTKIGVYPAHDGTADGIRAAAARGYAGGYLP